MTRLLESRLRAAGAARVIDVSSGGMYARRLSGRFYFDRAPRPTHLLPWAREDPGERRRLWRLCEQAV